MHRILLCLLYLNLIAASEYATVNIQGQLGNQLFQTAAVLAYARDHGCEARFPSLKTAINASLNLRHVFHRLDTSDFPEGTDFESFNETAPDVFTEPPNGCGSNICFNGYFPSLKYFSRHGKYIRNLFAPTEELENQIRAKYRDLLGKPTVAVHVRTFIPDSFDPNNGIGRTNWTYFINAIECFPDDYTILIFSDAPEWVKDRFPVWLLDPWPASRNNIHFVQGNPHYFDFYLMSLCDHQVLGPKSTFSWWAAWMNANPDKIVIRPDDRWLPDDAYPASWRKISIE